MMCPLCKSEQTHDFHEDKKRRYLKCYICAIIFVRPEDYLTPSEEKIRYDHHKNNPDDENYVNFLNQLIKPLKAFITPGQKGLDFGSGPEPVLANRLKEEGYLMNIYDIFYADNPLVFEEQYDFITATEVVEHLHDPNKEIKRLFDVLKPQGVLAIMTQVVPENFQDWYYKNDHTHVCFFSEESFRWLAQNYNAEIVHHNKSVVIFRKN